jgi:hypothetical protein
MELTERHQALRNHERGTTSKLVDDTHHGEVTTGDGASGAVWSYSRHASDYPWNLDAVPASAISDVVAAASSYAISTRRLCDSGSRGGRQSEI